MINDETIIRKVCMDVKAKLKMYMNKMHIENPDDTSGLCVVHSILIFKNLKKQDLTTIFCTNEDHCFLMYKNKVIDIAAGDYKDLILVPHDNIKEHKSFWRIENKFKSIPELINSDHFIKENIVDIFGIEFFNKLIK